MMSVIPTNSIYSGWAPELSSISIYWPCLLAPYSGSCLKQLKPKWLSPPPSRRGVPPPPPPESRLLSPFLEDPPLLATTAVPWSRLPPLPSLCHLGHSGCALPLFCLLLSSLCLFPFSFPQPIPILLLVFWRATGQRAIVRLWISGDSLKTIALH